MTSSIYPLAFATTPTTITAGTNILSTPIEIVPDHVKPGGGGILRLYFSFTMPTDAIVSVRAGMTGDTLKGNLNADNSALVATDGYYRFDIDVEDGDFINLRANQNITVINLFRAHLVQFGA